VTLASYLTFVTLAVAVVLMPGADFAITMRNTLVGGRLQGWATAFGISVACAVQGFAAVLGLGAIIVASQPLFRAITWAGVLYLGFLAFQAARSAWRGDYPPLDAAQSSAATGFRQGFLSNITNPKVLVFYLAVLPHFLSGGLSWSAIPLALTHAVLALLYLMLLASAIAWAGHVLMRRRIRRLLDAATATVLGAFSLSLAKAQF
jgi:threonine/homoserine/homoserine lactone efflux protein